MDGERFDAIAKKLAGTSRRRALMAVGGGLVATVFGRAGGSSAQEFTTEADAVICANAAQLCNRDGEEPRSCGQNGACRCATIQNGDKRCVTANRVQCPRRRYVCRSNSDCPNNQVCIDVKGCCRRSTGARTACVERCGNA